MFCHKCGKELREGSKFCRYCGEKLVDTTLEEMKEPKAEERSADIDSIHQNNKFQSDIIKPGIKRDRKKIIGFVSVVFIIIVAVVCGKVLFSASGGRNVYAYFGDGKYNLITNLDDDKIIELDSARSDYSANDEWLSFSPDGKYIYYFTKYDYDSVTGSLCRAEYGKCSENSGKDDKYIEIIDSNVKIFEVKYLDDGSVLYKNVDGKFYYYDGKESAQIADNVYFYQTDKSGRLIYETEDSKGTKNLYGVFLDNIDNKIKLASNYYEIKFSNPVSDFDHILYSRLEDDESQTLYVAGFDKESEKLAEGIYYGGKLGDKKYFIVSDGEPLNLYDYVDDPYAESDAEITEPNSDDYIIPYYSYEMISGSDLSESNFDELYTSCINPLYLYGESTWWSYSMEDALNIDWGENNEALHEATKNFIDRFADSADENGYILVTDEVKKALIEISQKSDNPDREWQWMWLCYNKKQDGITWDYDAYYAACNKWNKAADRIYLREDLKNKENGFQVGTLYCFDKGTMTPVKENVLVTRPVANGIMYNTADMIKEKLSIDSIESYYDVYNLFYFDNAAENYVILKDGTSCRMSPAAAEAYADACNRNDAFLEFTKHEVFLMEDNGTLSMAPISDSVVDGFFVLSENAELLYVDDQIFYYAGGCYQRNNTSYGNLYVSRNGISYLKAKDIIISDIRLYIDGVILAYTDIGNNGNELSMIDSNGDVTLIGDNVKQYIRADYSTLLFISDDDLYYFNGKEKKKVKNDVYMFWSKNSMKIDQEFKRGRYMLERS